MGASVASIVSHWPFLTQEDVQQELLIILWRIHSRYPHYDDAHFRNSFVRSLGNAVASMCRLHQRDQKVFANSINTGSMDSFNGKKKKQEKVFFDNILEGTVLPEGYYVKKIKDIASEVSIPTMISMIKNLDAKKADAGKNVKAAREEIMELLRD